MPGYDGTGPMSMGPMTGGARGLCNVNNRSWTLRGGGPGFGMGRGRGYRNMYCLTARPRWMRAGQSGFGNYPTSYTKEEEVGFLKDQAAALKSELDAIDARLQKLES
ncbi:conserved hypothetical protein [uncultured Desulfobacterium sp.]|uniref:DUF5320 domain-containing protein n=1 Tax=uncultured Desulfobacterium sp. TaxID=201089 RepID=A0A445MRQ2_9BACT|nr:conserved hypothetical protein [uncultured Desulfobacterium sp.]